MPGRAIPRLHNCCACYSLRTGTLISGVGSMILAACTIVFIILVDHPIETILIQLPQNIVKIVLVFNLFMTILISGLLVLGVLKDRKFYMLPWVILGIMLVICLFISIIFTTIKYYQADETIVALIIFFAGLIIAGIYLYMWYVAYSYYRQLQEEDERLPYYKPPYSKTPR